MLICCCRVVLEKMHPEADAALAEHNRSALQSITCYATKALARQEGSKMYSLPFSGLTFASEKEDEWAAALSAPQKEDSMLAFLSSHQVSSTICSPFAALSGESSCLRDGLMHTLTLIQIVSCSNWLAYI